MDPNLLELSSWRAVLLATVPMLYAGAAVAAVVGGKRTEPGWRVARHAAALALLAALVSLAAMVAEGAGVLRGPDSFAGPPWLGLRIDALGAPMLVLVGFIGWVITGYSQTCLTGAPGQARYLRGLMLTLASVSLLVVTNHLVVMAVAWVATSLAVHGLLTFFDQRPQALTAAHKKFLASRVADACLFVAVAIVGFQLGTLEIDRAVAAARALPVLPAALQVAALLFATGAVLKCAQLPVHGWLIQVMEAPTPVSALLHAGVVNLGGFVLIRVGTLVADVPAAQALLVVVGSVTAVIASLVMSTRISIKVSLAWSTCAQMGFMLMQCGLGLYELALLHLVAHSLYKAHAFLAAGEAVEQQRLRQMTPPLRAPSAIAWVASAVIGVGVVAAAAVATGASRQPDPALWAVAGVLALALAAWLSDPVTELLDDPSGSGARRTLGAVAAAFGVGITGFLLHAAAAVWLGATGVRTAPSPAWAAGVLACFAGLFMVQGVLRVWPHGSFARRLYPAVFAGLYLDELFTRLTFRMWPARVPAAVDAPGLSATLRPDTASSA